MSTRLTWSLAAIALLVLLGSATRTVSSAQATSPLVKTASAHILVSARGMTLYLYTLDKHNKSVCTGACAAYWPPLLAPKGAKIAPTMAGLSGTFGVTTRSDGKRQLTYDGAPLYTFIKDKKAGDMAGQGALQGTWWVVVVKVAPPTSSNQGAAATPTPGAIVTPTPGVIATPTPGAIVTPTPSGSYGGY